MITLSGRYTYLNEYRIRIIVEGEILCSIASIGIFKYEMCDRAKKLDLDIQQHPKIIGVDIL